MERAVVHEVKDDGVAVFVPRFHVRGVVRLLGRARDGRGLIGVKNGNSVITDDDPGAVLPALDTSFEEVAIDAQRNRRLVREFLLSGKRRRRGREQAWGAALQHRL